GREGDASSAHRGGTAAGALAEDRRQALQAPRRQFQGGQGSQPRVCRGRLGADPGRGLRRREMAEAVIAIDTNILVYAHRDDAPFHEAARRCLTVLTEGRGTWAIPWPSLHEFFSVVTHPRIYQPPTSAEEALNQVSYWLASPSLIVLAETGNYWPMLSAMVTAGRVVGPRIHDARIAALCQLHGV